MRLDQDGPRKKGKKEVERLEEELQGVSWFIEEGRKKKEEAQGGIG